MKACHRCSNPWTEKDPPGYNNTCPQCGIALHACENCEHIVRRGPDRCVIPQAPQVRDPLEGNHCNWFSFAEAREAGAPPRSDVAISPSARAKFEQLFRRP